MFLLRRAQRLLRVLPHLQRLNLLSQARASKWCSSGMEWCVCGLNNYPIKPFTLIQMLPENVIWAQWREDVLAEKWPVQFGDHVSEGRRNPVRLLLKVINRLIDPSIETTSQSSLHKIKHPWEHEAGKTYLILFDASRWHTTATKSQQETLSQIFYLPVMSLLYHATVLLFLLRRWHR